MVKKIFFYCWITCISSTAWAQQEYTLHFMQTIPQSNYNNPAFVPKYNSYLGLPGISSIYISEFNSGFNYNDIFERREDDSLIVKLESLNNALKDRNFFVNEQTVDLLSFGLRSTARLYFNFNLTAKNYQILEYPDDLTALFINGNGAFVGETMNLELNIDGMGYFETGLGASYEVNEKLTVGARFKYLSGIVNVNSEKAQFNLFTDEFYQLTLSGNVDVRTSGINEITDDEFDPSINDLKNYFKNSGYAFDIGASYNITDEISVAASITDIGSIKWKNDVTTYALENQDASFTYRGIDVQKLINDEDEFDEILDSLETTFEFVENEDAKAYRAPVPTRFYINGNYKLPMNAQVGLVVFGEKYENVVQSGLGVVANKQVGKIVDISLSYSMRKNTYNNFGAGFALRLPPFQIYAVSDNMLGAPMYPNAVKNVNLRLGINMVFDWNKEESAIPNALM